MLQSKKLSQHTTAGVSFIEILVLLLLISMFMSFVAPRFLTNPRGKEKKEFFSQFSQLLSDTIYQAITSKKIHQVFFDFDHREIKVKIHTPSKEEQDKHKQFKPVPEGIFHSSTTIPERLVIKNFFIQGVDEMGQGKVTHDAWFYIMPDGTSQTVTINIEDENEETNNQFAITINPFYSQAKLHDTFAKP
jgi:type II secretory pathway pseudopilin PulG